MERLEAKKIGGKTYYYYSRWGWVDGKCRRLWQKYLGKLEDIAKAVDGGPAPLYAEVFEFGLPTAMWKEAQRQEVALHTDSLCPKRKQGLSVGEYLAVAAVNRAVEPVSKRAMWDWFSQTTLRRALPDADQAALASQRFWDHMAAISERTASEVWQRIFKGAVEREGIDLSRLCYDGTNFYTFINTFNAHCDLARRGKNKQGRSNLRQVSYALFCSRDGHVPVYYDLYDGNTNDAKQFPVMIERFGQFLEQISGGSGNGPSPEVTVVFDKGNNSAANIALLDALPLHFVGSVKLDEHKDLAAISNRDPRMLPCVRPRLEGFKAICLSKFVYGKERKVVVTFNQELFNTQLKTVHADIDKALAGLAEIRKRLEDRANGLVVGGRAPTVESVRKQCDQLLRRPFLVELIPVRVEAGPRLEYRVDSNRIEQLSDTLLGKTLIISSRSLWDAEEIIEAYHSQFIIEHVFREMKDRTTGTWWPLNHWTDQKIRVHGLYCTIAILLRALIQRRAVLAGMPMSMNRLLAELHDIREVVNVYKRKPRAKAPRHQTVLTKMNEVQERLAELLELEAGTADLG
jgi:transposase